MSTHSDEDLLVLVDGEVDDRMLNAIDDCPVPDDPDVAATWVDAIWAYDQHLRNQDER